MPPPPATLDVALLKQLRHCEELKGDAQRRPGSDEAIQFFSFGFWIASLSAKLAEANFVAGSQ